MAHKIVNRAKMNVSGTPGTGAITLGSAVAGFDTFADAGVANGDTVSYFIEDGNNFEWGVGTYSSTGPTLTRTSVGRSSSGTSAISASSSAQVGLTALADDLGGTFFIGEQATTSGSSHAINNIPPCKKLIFVAENIRMTTGRIPSIALSVNNGSTYGATFGLWYTTTNLVISGMFEIFDIDQSITSRTIVGTSLARNSLMGFIHIPTGSNPTVSGDETVLQQSTIATLAAAPVNALRLSVVGGSGTFNLGSFKLYGVK